MKVLMYYKKLSRIKFLKIILFQLNTQTYTFYYYYYYLCVVCVCVRTYVCVCLRVRVSYSYFVHSLREVIFIIAQFKNIR